MPLRSNGMSEAVASLGAWKSSLSSALVRHGGGVFASLDEERPAAFPTDAASDKTSNPFKTVKLTWHESVSLGYKTFSNQLETKLMAVDKGNNGRKGGVRNGGTGLRQKSVLKENLIERLDEAAIVDDADKTARELEEEILEKPKYGHTPGQIRGEVDSAETPTGGLRNQLHEMFKNIVGKPKAKETNDKPRSNKAMSATTTTESDNKKMHCLNAKYSHAQETEPGSYPLESADFPEKFDVTVHGDGSIGNALIAIDFNECFKNGPINTAGQRAKLNDFDPALIWNAPVGVSSDDVFLNSNSKNGAYLVCEPTNLTSYLEGTSPMDASTDNNAQKVLESGDFSRKIVPSADSVGDINFHVFTVEDMFDMQLTFNSYDFNEACNGTTGEQFSKATVVASDALTFLTPPTTTTPVLTGDSFVICQNNPKRPGTASYLRYEMYKSANTKHEFHMLGGTSADLLWDRKKGYITVCDSADSMDTDNLAAADGDSGDESDDGTGMTDAEFLTALALADPP